VSYREAYALFACNGILFGHEALVRGEISARRKINGAYRSFLEQP